MTLDWNAARFDPSRAPGAGHVESWFLKLNDRAGRRALWLKATILSPVVNPGRSAAAGNPGAAVAASGNPGHAVAEAWAIAFDRDSTHVAVKETFPCADARFSHAGLDVVVGTLRLTEGTIAGTLAHAGHTIAFDLGFTPGAPPLVPFPSTAMYTAAVPKSKLVSPHPDSRFSGSYTVDGAAVEVADWRGMQGHNWGRGHAELYAWGHCNQWDQEPDFVLEAVSARVKVGPVLAPLTTLVCVRHRGVRYEWNRPLDLARSRGDIGRRRWTFRAASDVGRIEGELVGATEDFVGLYYPNPDGAMTYCLNTKLAHARVLFEPRGRAPMTLTSRTAALEIGTRDPDHGIRMAV